MAQIDAFTGLLPFVLTYVVLYAALKDVPVIKDNDKFPPLIAVIGAFFVARFIVVNPFYQDFFVTFFGKLVVGLIGFIGLLILLAFTGFNVEKSNAPILMVLMIAIAGAAFTSAGGFGPPWNLSVLSSAELSSLIGFTLDSGLIWILVVGGALFWVSGDENNEDGPSGMDFMKWMLGESGEDPEGG
ncbi:MAG: hypothetical protein BRC29_01160 [Nanohaloarchaea archaeon SW_7_43_1]|nr:MAG: hypothetical protein BRC29_01160 [Nanohaloarchaea archaeon SW_7_43_1]